jgi:hypothetical protein
VKYIIQVEIDADAGESIEANMAEMQKLLGQWQALNPIGIYFSLTRRAVTIILDAANEDAFFEPLHATWQLTSSYPDVWPVADIQEFPSLLQRAGLT